MIEWTQTGRCLRIADVPAGAVIAAVTGREAFGACEVCGGPILDGQDYRHDSEGIMWHVRCRRLPYCTQPERQP